jgi:ATP-dependent helicase/nuclease subunit A
MSDQQTAAVAARGEIVVAAGAGTGKTTLVIERVRAALEAGTAPERVLVVTYTEAAARELAVRMERALPVGVEAARPQVGTIHALAARLLREYAAEAGLPAEIRVLDEAEALVLSEAAFADTIARERRDGESDLLDLLGEYGVAGSRALIRSLDARLRAAGAPAPLLPPAHPGPGLLAPLRDATQAAVAALAGDARPQAASDLRRLARIEALLAGTPTDRELLALAAPKGEVAGSVSDLLGVAQQEASARLEHEVGLAVAGLLERYREAYRVRKEAELALDFDDLQERACELLEREAIGEAVRERFDLVLVDEFQDTNGLQCRLLDALAGPDCQRVFVGDACQSIYRFRYADVELFRERGERAQLRLPLTGSYRARPELLTVIGHVFAERFDERDFEPPHPLRTVEPMDGPALELHLVAGGDATMRTAPARELEAAALARRLRELVDAGEAAPGEIAILLRSSRDASIYASALERVGLAAHSQLGRGFYRSQQVRDLCAYLALLRNRFDDHALLVVLASPLVGVTNDGLAALRTAAQAALYWPIELGQLDGLPEADRALVERFRKLYDGLVRASAELGLAALLERIASEHDYELACLTAPDGERRFGNVRKLVRTARAYERDRGPDLAGFVDQMRLCDERDLSQADAPPGGAEDAVALMTIHAAKGLEFAVVCVPDLSRQTPGESGAVAVGPDGELGLRLRDARGKALNGPVYARLSAAAKAADEAESDRVAYVAWTRARDRLLLGGWLGGKKNSELQRVLGQFGVVAAALEPGVADVDVAGVPVRVHVHTGESLAVPAPPAAQPEEPVEIAPDGQLSLFDAPLIAVTPWSVDLPPPLEPLPAAALHVPRALSYSALALHDRCGFSYYAERVIGLRPAFTEAGPLRGALLGDALHHAVAVGVELACEGLEADDRAGVETLVAAWEGSSLAARLSAAGSLIHELPFAFCEDDVVLRGSLDICVRSDEGGLLVADLKTAALAGRDPAAVVESEYSLQRSIYALAALRSGAPSAEIAFCFLERPEDPVVRLYTAADAEALAGDLRDAIGRLRASTFSARSGDHCAACPALDRLCPAPGWRGRAPA